MTSESNREVEVKIPLAITPNQAVELLQARGYQVIRPRVFEANDVYDTPGQTLRNAGELLRLRRAGAAAVLTYKGVTIPGKHKTREELELAVSDPDMFERILTRLGYRRSFRYEKYRTEFRRGAEPGEITIDETPIGLFLELEGDPSWIDRAAAELGFSEKDYLTDSYGALFFQYRARHNFTKEQMTFD